MVSHFCLAKVVTTQTSRWKLVSLGKNMRRNNTVFKRKPTSVSHKKILVMSHWETMLVMLLPIDHFYKQRSSSQYSVIITQTAGLSVWELPMRSAAAVFVHTVSDCRHQRLTVDLNTQRIFVHPYIFLSPEKNTEGLIVLFWELWVWKFHMKNSVIIFKNIGLIFIYGALHNGK